MKLVNVYPGKLVLPDGTEVLPGASVEISKEVAENAGVKEWLEAEWLVKPGAVRAAPTDDTASLKKALADAEGSLKALTAELDTERAKSADLEAKLAEANAALEAATKPAAT